MRYLPCVSVRGSVAIGLMWSYLCHHAPQGHDGWHFWRNTSDVAWEPKAVSGTNFSAVLEGQLHGAAAAVILVHAFGRESVGNWSDFSDFVCELGGTPPIKERVSGPYNDLPTYFLWCQQLASD